ncbi:MAG TPA: sodium-dependent phosphate transporter [Ruminococcaceae bacterium]|nr:sodium-dependent phosphate transporter [Oscillospiraceae bacterium]
MSIYDILSLLGGLGLFLFGMKLMSEGLELTAGSKLQKVLKTLTSNKFMGAAVGLFITAIIQSSSATTVMVVGFVNAGLMSLAQAAGVIMGANIGTTITSVLVAINPKQIAPVAVIAGAVMVAFFKKKSVTHVGQIIVGLGILFMGLNMMSDAMVPLRDYEPFLNIMVEFSKNPFLGLLAGMLVTAIIQSSSASVAILQAFAMQGLIRIDAAVFILFGQNIGTCVTALLASVGTNKTARRAAVVHLLFNVMGTVLFIGLFFVGEWTVVPSFTEVLEFIVPGNNTTAQISVAHIIFNIVSTLVMLPASNLLVKLSRKIIRGEDKQIVELKPKYIDDRLLNTPAIAVAQVLREVERMSDLARENMLLAMKAFEKLDDKMINEVLQREKTINFLNHTITAFLIKLNILEQQERDAKIIGALFHIVNDLERVGDHAENITDDAKRCIDSGNKLSLSALSELKDMFNMALDVYDRAIVIFKRQKFTDKEIALIAQVEEDVDLMADHLEENHIRRLNMGECTPQAGTVFINMVSNLERFADHSTNIAYAVVDES